MFDENLLNSELFTNTDQVVGHTAESFYNIEQIVKKYGIDVPEFMTLDEEKVNIEIRFDGRFFIDGSDVKYDEPDALYEDIISKGYSPQFEFTDEYKGSSYSASLFGDLKNRKTGKIYKTESNTNRPLAFSHYFKYLQLAKKYLNNSEDFVLSYRFLELHPAFWTRTEHDPNYWITYAGLSGNYVLVLTDKKNKPTICFEHGAAYGDRYTTCHDYRLDVYAPTFEDAYIQLAALVHKYFYLDGSEREDIESIEPDWLIKVKNRLANYDPEKTVPFSFGE